MRVTKRTNIAMRVLMYCAANPGRLVTKHEIAERCNASENHLAQVINQLAQMGFLHTQRGRNGGLELGRPAADIVIGDIFRALEQPVPLAECFADVDNTCPLTEACRLRSALTEAANAFYATLDPITLDSLVCNNAALINIISAEGCSAGRRDASLANA
ncbi:RrF2 family transcriptional regulator [Mameliella sediminis]|uniref:RrF2 family transcriptional regulator n=1 Tax=Mameliella sediminis TaxID=2836866 RepID=UPI001C46A6B9|nr:Rrf2 family transcriptional regulator [Mameliella sediminis]MBY6114117.1 Rrf2 family transcriptional regulator [Antarctobacter heliothermus]MBY6142535.1 Rrf2 family transcriptional regulator [Mameliella alba]MBV7395414.1 Rrf2 family transcriptional regulator [Mameliella sediminis]MBY6159363.1 Rrf2 family transcriptional regulator [Mameliella alba]MBY6167834.1 Rrf2 family transcriptional regulator [Mameliella alba]